MNLIKQAFKLSCDENINKEDEYLELFYQNKKVYYKQEKNRDYMPSNFKDIY
jgi:hypothetical protein